MSVKRRKNNLRSQHDDAVENKKRGGATELFLGLVRGQYKESTAVLQRSHRRQLLNKKRAIAISKAVPIRALRLGQQVWDQAPTEPVLWLS